MRNYTFIMGGRGCSCPPRAGFEPSVPGLAGSPQVPVWGWWGQPRATEDVRACVRACVGAGEPTGRAGGGGAHEARRAGQRERTASSRQAPPRARREWFSPAPGSLCSSHAGPRWRRRWRPRACDHKEGAGGWTGARWRRLRPRPGPLPSASRPPSSGRPPRPRRRGPAPPPTARLAWCGGRARRHGGEAGAEAQVARGGRARRLPVAAAGLRECRPAFPQPPLPRP